MRFLMERQPVQSHWHSEARLQCLSVADPLEGQGPAQGCGWCCFRNAHQAAGLARSRYHGKQLAILLCRNGDRGSFLRLDDDAILAGGTQNDLVVTGLQRVFENGNEIAASFDRGLRNDLTVVDDFKLRARRGLARNDGGTIWLNAQHIESWRLCRIARCRGWCGSWRRCSRSSRCHWRRSAIVGSGKNTR